jgi:hypothetical protein
MLTCGGIIMKCKEYNSIEQMEFDMLKPIEIKVDMVKKQELVNSFHNVTAHYTRLGWVIYSDTDITIFADGYHFYAMPTTPAIKEDDILLFETINGGRMSNNDLMYKIIDPDVMNELKKNPNFDNRKIMERFEWGTTINKEKYIKSKLAVLAEEKKSRQDEDTRRKERNIEAEEAKKSWRESSIYTNDSHYNQIVINGNQLKYGNTTIVIEPAFNKIYQYDEIGHKWDKSIGIVGELIAKNVNHITYTDNHNTHSFDILIADRKSTMNGVLVTKNKILTILRNAKSGTNEEIETLNKMGVTKLSLFNIDEVNVNEIKIPFSAKAIDEDNFEITFGNKAITAPWTEIRPLFGVVGYALSKQIQTPKFMEFMQKYLNIDKSGVFKYLGDYKLLGDI